MTTDIAVLGPLGDDECARYIGDGLTAIGATVRLIDPLRVRDILKPLGLDMLNHHYHYRKPVSLKWLAEHHTERCDIRGCSIFFITDQPVEYVNDLEPLDDLGNKPIVVAYHNEYNQPPGCLNADIVAYGQPQLRGLTQALYPWQSANWRREFDLPGAVFLERYTRVTEKTYPGIVWVGDNSAGTYGGGGERYGKWHSLAYDIWHSMDEKVELARAQGISIRDQHPEIAREEYLSETQNARAALMIHPDHIWCSRRLFESIAVGTLPIIHVQVERYASPHNPGREYNWRLDKVYTNERFLAQMGFVNGVNCLTFTDFRQLPFLDKFVKENPALVAEMVDRAYELVRDRHTFQHRARQVLSEVQLYRDIVVHAEQESKTGVGLPYQQMEVQL